MAAGAVVGSAIVGTGLQIYGKRKEAQAREAAARAEAGLKRQQALDILDRFEINEKQMRIEGKVGIEAQQAAFAKGGVTVGTGVSLVAMEQTARDIQKTIDFEREEAVSRANALLAGATLEEQFAVDIKKAAKYEQAGMFLSGVGTAASGLRK